MKNDSALFFTCSLIEFIGRKQKQRRSMVVKLLGKDNIKRIYDYADIFHCEPIEKVTDEFIHNCNIPEDSFDNIGKCRYEVSDYWAIGEVSVHEDFFEYRRNIMDVLKAMFTEFDFNEETDFMIEEVNGVKIPADYLEFAHRHNGGGLYGVD